MERRAIAYMVAAMACYALNDALVKALASGLPAGQVLAARGLIACLLLAGFAAVGSRSAQSGPQTWQGWTRPAVWIRCAMEACASICAVLALGLAPLAMVTGVVMCAPLLTVLASLVLRWDAWNGRRMLAAGMGLVGAFMAIRPSLAPSAASSGVVASVGCALSLAVRDLAARRLPVRTSAPGIAGLAAGLTCVCGLLLGTREAWVALDHGLWISLTAAALCAAAGSWLLVLASRYVQASVVAPFRYSLILWASALGYLGWNERPGGWESAGMLLIALAGVLTLRSSGACPRERMPDRRTR